MFIQLQHVQDLSVFPSYKMRSNERHSSFLSCWLRDTFTLLREYAMMLGASGRISENFYFSFVTFRWGCLFTLFVLQFWVWIISNYKTHKQWKHFYTGKLKSILRLTFNLGLARPNWRNSVLHIHTFKFILQTANITYSFLASHQEITRNEQAEMRA